MQEDAFYSKYLERKYTTQSKIDSVDLEKNIKSLAEKILGEIPKPSGLQTERVEQILKESEIGQLVDRFEDNRTLSEVFLHNDGWTEIVEAWSDDPSFQKEITDLKVSGLLTFKDDDIKRPKLTPIGKAVAERLAQDKRLWNNKNERYFPKKK